MTTLIKDFVEQMRRRAPRAAHEARITGGCSVNDSVNLFFDVTEQISVRDKRIEELEGVVKDEVAKAMGLRSTIATLRAMSSADTKAFEDLQVTLSKRTFQNFCPPGAETALNPKLHGGVDKIAQGDLMTGTFGIDMGRPGGDQSAVSRVFGNRVHTALFPWQPTRPFSLDLSKFRLSFNSLFPLPKHPDEGAHFVWTRPGSANNGNICLIVPRATHGYVTVPRATHGYVTVEWINGPDRGRRVDIREARWAVYARRARPSPVKGKWYAPAALEAKSSAPKPTWPKVGDRVVRRTAGWLHTADGPQLQAYSIFGHAGFVTKVEPSSNGMMHIMVDVPGAASPWDDRYEDAGSFRSRWADEADARPFLIGDRVMAYGASDKESRKNLGTVVEPPAWVSKHSALKRAVWVKDDKDTLPGYMLLGVPGTRDQAAHGFWRHV